MDEQPQKSRDDRRPWERQFGESGKAYAAFLAYRDQGLTRTIEAVRQIVHKGSIIYRWAKRWKWSWRADQWDVEMQREAEKAMRSRIRDEKNFHEILARDAVVFVAKGLARLAKKMEDDKDWCPPARDLAYMMDTSVKLHRITLDLDKAPISTNTNVHQTLVFNQQEFSDALGVWARRLPVEVRKELGLAMDLEFEKGIEQKVAEVEAEIRRIMPPRTPKEGNGQR